MIDNTWTHTHEFEGKLETLKCVWYAKRYGLDLKKDLTNE